MANISSLALAPNYGMNFQIIYTTPKTTFKLKLKMFLFRTVLCSFSLIEGVQIGDMLIISVSTGRSISFQLHRTDAGTGSS